MGHKPRTLCDLRVVCRDLDPAQSLLYPFKVYLFHECYLLSGLFER